ncbi:MAG: hypothetical protein KKC71_07020 [Chloroflexi bacterium]|nr:hypothetical protein [Chloroflexota bacterium]
MSESLIGQSLGRYHILEHASTMLSTGLGEGGMATVYKAFDTRLERGHGGQSHPH